MAWSSSRGAYNSNIMSSASMDYMLMRDEALIIKESTLHQHLPLTSFPFRGDLARCIRPAAPAEAHDDEHYQGNIRPLSHKRKCSELILNYVDNTHARGISTTSARSNDMQAMETIKRPLFWPFLDVERVKRSLSPDHNVVNEQSASTSEFFNVSNTAMMERMQEVELNMNEGESRIRKKKRLTGEQLCALEGSFEADKKLEAQRKQYLAQRLGLEPRQVAVWFQNRRARSKTKHLEHDFALLKSKYDYMLAETLKLRSEVSRLTAELEATKGEAGGAKQGAASCEIQLAPILPLQNSGSNPYTTKDVKSNNMVMEAAHVSHEGSNLLSKSEENYIVINGMKQNRSSTSASPSISCSRENSYDDFVEGKSSDYNTSPTCISEEIEHAELPASITTRFEYADTNYSSLPHLKTVNDIPHYILQASHHLNFSGDDCLHPLSSHHHVAFDCLWELTT